MARVDPSKFLCGYLTRRQITKTEFARSIGVNRAYFYMLCSGGRRAGLAVATLIDRATRSAVPAESWVSFVPRRRAAGTAS